MTAGPSSSPLGEDVFHGFPTIHPARSRYLCLSRLSLKRILPPRDERRARRERSSRLGKLFTRSDWKRITVSLEADGPAAHRGILIARAPGTAEPGNGTGSRDGARRSEKKKLRRSARRRKYAPRGRSVLNYLPIRRMKLLFLAGCFILPYQSSTALRASRGGYSNRLIYDGDFDERGCSAPSSLEQMFSC